MIKGRISFSEASVWLLAIFMLLLIIGSYVTGELVKRQYQQTLQNVAASLQAEVKILHYQQGYFKSLARYELIFSEHSRLQFSEDIIHGPLYLGLINQGHSPFVLALIKGRLLSASRELGDSLPWLLPAGFIYQNIINYNGNADIQAYLPAIKTVLGASVSYQLSTAPLQIKASYQADVKKLVARLELPSIHIQSDAYQLKSRRLELSFSALAAQGPVILGDALLSMEYFEYQSAKEQWLLHNLIAQLKNSQQADNLSISSHINLREVFASNERFGPLELKMNIKGLNALALQQLIEKSRHQQLATGYQKFLPDLLDQAQLEIQSLHMSSDLGQLQTHLSVSMDELAGEKAISLSELTDFGQWHLSLSIDKLLMEQIVHWQIQFHETALPASEAIIPVAASETKLSMQQKVIDRLQDLQKTHWLILHKQQYLCELKISRGRGQLNQQPVSSLLAF